MRSLAQSVVCGALILFLAPTIGRADFIGSDTDGPLDAKVSVTLSTNTIQITLTDLSAPNGSTWSIGQAIADVGFNISGLTGTATITGVSGTLIDPKNGKTSQLTLSNNVWTIDSSSSSPPAIALGTIGWTYDGLSVGGAPPDELIANGNYENDWNSSLFTGSHIPDILSSATFTIYAPGVTSSSAISNMKVAFGTGPEKVLSGTPEIVPAPPSIVLCGFGALCLAGFLVVSRRRRMAAA
jgi:hypothetical protein